MKTELQELAQNAVLHEARERRRALVAELRDQGVPLRVIAEALGDSPERVANGTDSHGKGEPMSAPFSFAADAWSIWTTELDDIALALSGDTMLPDQHGLALGGHITVIDDVSAAAARIALSASELSGVCSAQALYDEALTGAPSPDEVEEARRLADKYGGVAEKIYKDLKEERDAAVEQHRADTEGTVMPEVPTAGSGVTDCVDLPEMGDESSGIGGE